MDTYYINNLPLYPLDDGTCKILITKRPSSKEFPNIGGDCDFIAERVGEGWWVLERPGLEVGSLVMSQEGIEAEFEVHVGHYSLNPKNIPFLQQAHNLIHGQRAVDYGSASQNFAQIAALWSALLATKLTKPITPSEVAMLMQQLKMARLVHQPGHQDSLLDNAGYAGLLPIIQKSQEKLPGILGDLA